MQKTMGESMEKPFDLVFGRKTYEIFAAHWPHTDDFGAEPLNRATKHVASATRTELEWENSELIEGDVPEGVRALKQQDGPELQVHGSATPRVGSDVVPRLLQPWRARRVAAEIVLPT